MNQVETVMHIVGAALIIGGAVFCVIGALGVVRLPDFYSRCHGAGITDSAGAAGILFGLCFMSSPLIAFKLITILAFLWLSSTASTHALVQAAFARGVRVDQPTHEDWTHSKDAQGSDATSEEAASEDADDQAASEDADDETASEDADDQAASEDADDQAASEDADDQAASEDDADDEAPPNGDADAAEEGGANEDDPASPSDAEPEDRR